MLNTSVKKCETLRKSITLHTTLHLPLLSTLYFCKNIVCRILQRNCPITNAYICTSSLFTITNQMPSDNDKGTQQVPLSFIYGVHTSDTLNQSETCNHLQQVWSL